MKALLLVDEDSDKIALKSVEIPDIKANEVLIKIKAAALNHRDQWCRQGMYPGITYNTILGSDGCGIVEEVGSEVDNIWKGRDVVINPNIGWGDNPEAQSLEYNILGMPSNGTFAEYIVVPIDRVHQKPKHLSCEEAAAVPLGGLTAYRAVFTKGNVARGMKVLITGIGGGVAQFAFLFCQSIGAEVYITSGDDDKLEKAITNGANGGYNYKSDKWDKTALKETGGFDVIIDSAGGNNINTYIKLIKMGGRIVHYGSTSGMPEKFDIFRLFWSQASIHGSTMGNDVEFQSMLDLVEHKSITPIVDSVRHFDEVVSAFDQMKLGKQFGKLVVSMD